MDIEIKKQIVEAAISYAYAQGWVNPDKGTNGATKLANISGVNIAYISNMLNGFFTYRNSTKNTQEPLADEHFEKLAKAIGYSIGKQYWVHARTKQFDNIIFELNEAKEEAATRVLIGEAGCGKTYTIGRFVQNKPEGTYVVTCFREDRLGDLLNKVERVLRLVSKGSNSERIHNIAMELYRSHKRGEKPVIIFDESESLTMRTFAMLKSLYDALNWTCGIVLIGTDDLVVTIEKMKKHAKPGMPQFYRRFKAGIRNLGTIDRSFSDFFVKINVEPTLRRTLLQQCENYGELHDYLEPAMKKADTLGKPLTNEFFKSYHKLDY